MSNFINLIFHEKSFNEDTKKITKKLINNSYELGDHNLIMNETDRTIVGLLWHENVIDVLGKVDKDEAIPIYCKMLDNICFSDYIDRITFQKQIWQFNEMSMLIKIGFSNLIFHLHRYGNYSILYFILVMKREECEEFGAFYDRKYASWKRASYKRGWLSCCSLAHFP